MKISISDVLSPKAHKFESISKSLSSVTFELTLQQGDGGVLDSNSLNMYIKKSFKSIPI